MSAHAENAVSFRFARCQDLSAIVQMLADDALGSKREDCSSPMPDSYQKAFNAIDSDPNNELVVAISKDQIIGVLQITFIPYLTYQGGWRALVEGVRVSRFIRSSGIGRSMLEWAIDRAKKRGCVLIQLTTDKLRPDALQFYEKLGFVASHEGMKLKL